MTIISAIKARKLLNKGCSEYLASLVGGEGMKLSVEDIPVVYEYQNVFPDDLSGPPSDR